MRNLLLALCLLLSLSTLAQDTSRFMFYNLLRYPGETPGRIQELKKIVAYSQPDVLMVCELESEEGASKILNQALNVGGVNSWGKALFKFDGSFNNMLFYDATKYKLINQTEINGWPRFVSVYQLLYKGALKQGDTILVECLVGHLKAGNSDANARKQSADFVMNYIRNLSTAKNIIFAGDFNVYSGDEPAVTALTTGAERFYDPIDFIGDWSNNDYYAPLHTQSTRTSNFGDGSTGGLDDRFDLILVSKDVLQGTANVKYLEDSYEALGNDGDHFNKSIISGGNEAVPDSIANALHEMSDHLPVLINLFIDEDLPVLETSKAVPTLTRNKNGMLISLPGNVSSSSAHIIDMQGRQVGTFRFKANSQLLIPNSLLADQKLYIIRVFYDGNVFTRKLLIPNQY